ncbi:MAG: flippase [Rubrivivax sp.]
MSAGASPFLTAPVSVAEPATDLAPGAAAPAGPLLNRAGARDGVTLLVEQLLRIGLVTVVAMWIARQLGPESFGVLNYASAVVAIFHAVVTLGLDNPVLMRLSRGHHAAGVVLGSALALRLAVGIACVPLSWLLVSVMRPSEPDAALLTMVVALSLPLYAPGVVDLWFKQRQVSLPAAATRFAATLVGSLAKVACLIAGAGVLALAWTIALEAALACLGLWAVHRTLTHGRAGEALVADAAQMRELLKGCAPHALATLAIVAYMKVDVMMLGMLSTRAETGLYSLSQKLCEVLYVLPVVVADVLYPRLARHADVTRGAGNADSQVFFDLTTGAALAGTLMAVAVAGWLVPAVFGEAYRRSAEVFQVHAFSCIGIAMAHARLKWMVAAGRERTGLALTVIGLVVAVVLHAVLVPLAGAWGAAVAAVCSFFICGYVASWLVPSLREVARMQTRAFWPWGRLSRSWRAWRGGLA